MNNDWTINTLIGLGQIRFGTSPANVAALSAIYGVVEGKTRKKAVAKVVARSRALFGKYFSDEDLAAGEAYAAGLAAGPDELTQTLAGSGLVLDYAAEKLVAITASPAASLCNFRREPVFARPAAQLLALLEDANGAPGWYASTGAAFDRIAVYLDAFTIVSGSGAVRPLADGDERFRTRTVTLRATPYAVTEFLSDGTSRSFPGASATP